MFRIDALLRPTGRKEIEREETLTLRVPRSPNGNSLRFLGVLTDTAIRICRETTDTLVAHGTAQGELLRRTTNSLSGTLNKPQVSHHTPHTTHETRKTTPKKKIAGRPSFVALPENAFSVRISPLFHASLGTVPIFFF